jgi:hypothetical protein
VREDLRRHLHDRPPLIAEEDVVYLLAEVAFVGPIVDHHGVQVEVLDGVHV